MGGFLLHNDGNGVFTNVSNPAGVRGLYTPLGDVAVTWATVFFDYNNDGWLDLFYVRGMINATQTPQPDVFFENNHDGTFTDISEESGLNDDRRGRSASICDFDQDGYVDLFVGNYGWPTCLFHNESGIQGNTNHWLTLTAEGTTSNRDAIGTRFYLTTPDGITQMRDINSGPTHGGGDYKAGYFGLGTHTTGTLSVRWPTGVVQDLGTVTADQHMHLIEPTATGVAGQDPIVSQYALSQNYPNPFNPATVIKYSVATESHVSLKVYDALGREVATLMDGLVAAGNHQATLNAASLASGVYFYRLKTATFTDTKRLVVLK
jgi:hypothetical protein